MASTQALVATQKSCTVFMNSSCITPSVAPGSLSLAVSKILVTLAFCIVHPGSEMSWAVNFCTMPMPRLSSVSSSSRRVHLPTR